MGYATSFGGDITTPIFDLLEAIDGSDRVDMEDLKMGLAEAIDGVVNHYWDIVEGKSQAQESDYA